MKQYLLLAGVSLLIGCDQTNSKTDSTQNKAPQEKVMMTIEVGPEKVDCVGVAPMKCLVIDGALFYDHIIGFEFEAGYKYTLQVEKTQRFTSENATCGYKPISISFNQRIRKASFTAFD